MKKIDDNTLAPPTPMGEECNHPATGDADELERLLPGLPDAILSVQNEDDDEEHYRHRRNIARACELLIDERRWRRVQHDVDLRRQEEALIEARAQRDAAQAQLAAAPSGLQVARLLAAVEAVHAECRAAGYGSNDVGRCLDLIRAHLGDPTPEEGVAAEVLARHVVDAYGTDLRDGLSPAKSEELARRLLRAEGGRFPSARRDRLVLATRALIAGIVARDAAAEQKGGA